MLRSVFLLAILSTSVVAAEQQLIPIGLDHVPHPKDDDEKIAKDLNLSYKTDLTPWSEDTPGHFPWPAQAGQDKYLEHLKDLKRRGFLISLTFTVVHMDQKHLPLDIIDKPFNDPVVLDRWEKYLTGWLNRYGDAVDCVNIGNELDHYFGGHPKEWKAWLEFMKRSYALAHRTHPKLKIGTVLAADQCENYWKDCQSYCDYMGCTYYAPSSTFVKNPTSQALDPKSKLYVGRALDTVLRCAGAKPVLFTEVGCATHEQIDSSPELQAQFIQELFKWMRGKEARILGMSWLAVSDWNFEGTRQSLEGNLDPKLLRDDRFLHYLTSLGLIYETGTPKIGYKVFKEEAASYRGKK